MLIEDLLKPPNAHNEPLLIAHEIRECLMHLLRQGEDTSHDELHALLFLVQCQILAFVNADAANKTAINLH